MPQPQLCRVRAASSTYATAHSNFRSLTQWAGPGLEPTSSWILVGLVTRWATSGTPRIGSSGAFYFTPSDPGSHKLLNCPRNGSLNCNLAPNCISQTVPCTESKSIFLGKTTSAGSWCENMVTTSWQITTFSRLSKKVHSIPKLFRASSSLLWFGSHWWTLWCLVNFHPHYITEGQKCGFPASFNQWTSG